MKTKEGWDSKGVASPAKLEVKDVREHALKSV